MNTHTRVPSATTRTYTQHEHTTATPSTMQQNKSPSRTTDADSSLNSSTLTSSSATFKNVNNNNNTSMRDANNQLAASSSSPLAVQSFRNIPGNSSFKDEKKFYNLRKKNFTKNIQSAIEAAHEAHSGWLKARTTFKRWTKVWCQIKPGYLILYTSQEAQKKHRFGVVLLSVCQLIKRPTKREGFCFKLMNPFACSVWALSSTRAIVFPQSSVTLRASDQSIGELWIDALNRCNLSANLEGYQPIVDHETGGARGNRSISSDSGDDDGEGSTRILDGLLDRHSNADSLSTASNANSSTAKSQARHGSSKNDLLGNGFPNDHSNSNKKSINGNENSMQTHANHLGYKVSSSQVGRIDSFNQTATNNNDYHRSRIAQKQPSSWSALRDDPSALKMVAKLRKYNWAEFKMENVNYIAEEGAEEMGGDGVQKEEIHEGNKSIIWHLIKQLRPGTDLSKVTLPTFILEPRSFLEKFGDYYYHCDILSDAVLIDDPVMRLIGVVRWYISGFYKKPKGAKKPYNPILGERFRCFWDHPKTQSRTFYVAEQVSHHPPISAFHVSNRKDGYVISCSILSRSRFGGNSVSAIFEGKAKLYLTKRNETYTMTLPFAQCRGILLGSLCLELGGKVEIECAETDCKCELDFKLTPVWSISSNYNALSGRILKSNRVTHTLDGNWDKKINIVDKRTDEQTVLWEVTNETINSRLKRYTVDFENQSERESVKLWKKVSDALIVDDHTTATVEKTKLEDMQRQEARERTGQFVPQHFEQKFSGSKDWHYKWQDNRVWNESQDIMQYEDNFKIKSLVLKCNTKAGPSCNFNPHIDMPITQLDKLIDKFGMSSGSIMKNMNDSEGFGVKNGSLHSNIDPEAVKSIQSNLEAKNQLIDLAIKQMTEKSRKLEEDIANLKRGKRTVACVMTAIIVALLSAFFTYFQ